MPASWRVGERERGRYRPFVQRREGSLFFCTRAAICHDRGACGKAECKGKELVRGGPWSTKRGTGVFSLLKSVEG
jgi:hypothetical protein